MVNGRFLSIVLFLTVCVAMMLHGVDRKVRLDTALGYDGGDRRRGYAVVYIGKWSLGVAGRWDPAAETQGMMGINSPLLTLGHLSDAGLAAEVRNPECSALSRLTERTIYRADLRSFSISRFGIAFTPWNGRVGIGWERRSNLDTALLWGTLVDRKIWWLEGLWAFGLLNEEEDEDWYPEKLPHFGGAFTTYAMRNRFAIGFWNGALTSIVSAGTSFKPGLLLAGSTGVSTGAWNLRMRGTWATEFYRNAEGELPDIPMGIALKGNYSPNRGLLFKYGFHIPLWTYHRILSGEKETGMVGLGWRFNHFEVRGHLEWDGLIHSPILHRIKGEILWNRSDMNLAIYASWDFERNWSAVLKWEWEIDTTWSIDSSVKLHRETALLADVRMRITFGYARGRIELSCTATDLPRDWQGGPSSAGDFDVEIRWLNQFHD